MATGQQFTIKVETDAFNRHIKDFMDTTNLDVQTVLRKYAFDLLAKVMTKTPVDTGRARSGWYPAGRALGMADRGSGRQSIIGRNIAGGNKRRLRTGSKLWTGKNEGSYREQFPMGRGNSWIEMVNSVPYIIFLEYGHSHSAPYGMVRLSMREMRRGELPKDMTTRIRAKWNLFYSRSGMGTRTHYGD